MLILKPRGFFHEERFLVNKDCVMQLKYSFRFLCVISSVFINRNFGAVVSYRCVGN